MTYSNGASRSEFGIEDGDEFVDVIEAVYELAVGAVFLGVAGGHAGDGFGIVGGTSGSWRREYRSAPARLVVRGPWALAGEAVFAKLGGVCLEQFVAASVATLG